MARVFNSFEQYLDNAGNPVSGGTLVIWSNKTTTSVVVHSNPALTVVQTNPYTLDASGRVKGDLFFSGIVSIQVNDIDGAQIRVEDDIDASTTTQSSDVTYTPQSGTVATDLDTVLNLTRRNFATVALAVADTVLALGDKVNVDDYTGTALSGVLFFEVVAAATGTVDGGSYINLPNTTPALQLQQNFPLKISPEMFGAVGLSGDVSDQVALDAAALAVEAFSQGSTKRDGTVLSLGMGKNYSITGDTHFRNISVEGNGSTFAPTSVNGHIRLSGVRHKWNNFLVQFAGVQTNANAKGIIFGPTAQIVTITRSGTTATVTSSGHPYANGDSVTITNAIQSEYNVTTTISNVTAGVNYDYTVAGTPASPATFNAATDVGIQATLTADVNQTSKNIIESLTVNNGTRGFVMDDTAYTAFGNTFINCRAERCSDWHWHMEFRTGSTTNTWINCHAAGSISESPTNKGFHISNSNEVNFLVSAVDGSWIAAAAGPTNVGFALRITNAQTIYVDQLVLESCEFDSTSATGDVLDNAASFVELSAPQVTVGNIQLKSCTLKNDAAQRVHMLNLPSAVQQAKLGQITEIFPVGTRSGTVYKLTNSNTVETLADHIDLSDVFTNGNDDHFFNLSDFKGYAANFAALPAAGTARRILWNSTPAVGDPAFWVDNGTIWLEIGTSGTLIAAS